MRGALFPAGMNVHSILGDAKTPARQGEMYPRVLVLLYGYVVWLFSSFNKNTARMAGLPTCFEEEQTLHIFHGTQVPCWLHLLMIRRI